MIKRLVIKNCLGIEELVLNPGKTNLISGGNEKGKTSILEAIEKALFNTKRRARFVRTGAEKAYIELDTDDGINIRRTVKEDAAGLDQGSVKVTSNGQPVKAPESFLKQLFGITGRKAADVFAFNPVDFMMKKDTEQTAILLALMPITVTSENALEWFGQAPKVNYEKHGLQVLRDLEQWFYDARREANARVNATKDESEAIAKRLPDNYDLDEWSGVNLGQLFQMLNNAQQTNRDIVTTEATLKSYPNEVKAANDRYDLMISRIQEEHRKKMEDIAREQQCKKDNIINQIKEFERKIEDLKREVDILDKTYSPEEHSRKMLTDQQTKRAEERLADELHSLSTKKVSAETFLEINKVIDTEPIKARCEEAEKMKSFIPLASEVKSLADRLNNERLTADNLDKCVETARTKPVELLAKIKLPLKGLGVDGRGIVTINGLPLSNLSTAQQVRTCLDIAKVLSKDNPLKLICVDKAEHLDESVRSEFKKQIEADKEWQYFITEVTDGNLKVEVK